MRNAAIALAAIILWCGGSAAQATPIYVSYDGSHGSGDFLFEPVETFYGARPLTDGSLTIDGYTIAADQLLYDYYPIADSLNIRIFGNEDTGLDPGDSVYLRFGNPDYHSLDLPTYASLSYTLGGERGSERGTITSVPGPPAAGLFLLAVAGLALGAGRRRTAAP